MEAPKASQPMGSSGHGAEPQPPKQVGDGKAHVSSDKDALAHEDGEWLSLGVAKVFLMRSCARGWGGLSSPLKGEESVVGLERAGGRRLEGGGEAA